MKTKLTKKDIRVAVLNFSGNVGKSTTGKHVFEPRLGVRMIAIETINENEGGDPITLKEFNELQDLLIEAKSACVDIGSSNVEGFFKKLAQYKRSHSDFDIFVIPVTPELKQQKDTIATVEALNALGVPSKKIRILFNKVETGEDVTRTFSAIFGYATEEKKCVVDAEATVYTSDIYEDIKALGVSIPDLLEHSEDELREKIRATENPEEKQRLKDVLIATRIAESAHDNLEAAFKAITK